MIPRAAAYLCKLSDPFEGFEVRAALHAGAQNGEHVRVFAGKSPCRDGRGASGADGCDVRAVHNRKRGSVLLIEEGYQRLVRGNAEVVVVGENRHKLDLEGDPGHIA